MPLTIEKSIDDFIQRFVDSHRQHNQELTVQFDSQWVSPCHTAVGNDGDTVVWTPQLREIDHDFESLQSALELAIDPQLKVFYSRYWSENIQARNERGQLTLLFPWNEDDFTRFQQNLVGHVLMKRRLQQPDTLFFAVTDEDDFILTVENQSGRVMLEQVGIEPTEVIANDLREFLQTLTPTLPD